MSVIISYLRNFSKFNISYNKAQEGLVKLITANTNILDYVNKQKASELTALTDEKLRAIAAKDDNAIAAADAKIKHAEAKYQGLITYITSAINAIQEQLKTIAQGAQMLPQIGETVIGLISKVVELASSIRV